MTAYTTWTHLCDHLPNFAEVCTASQIAASEEVLDEPHADVVPHLFELSVHFWVVAVEVAAELGDHGAVGEGDEFGVYFVDSCSGGVCEIMPTKSVLRAPRRTSIFCASISIVLKL